VQQWFNSRPNINSRRHDNDDCIKSNIGLMQTCESGSARPTEFINPVPKYRYEVNESDVSVGLHVDEHRSVNDMNRPTLYSAHNIDSEEEELFLIQCRLHRAKNCVECMSSENKLQNSIRVKDFVALSGCLSDKNNILFFKGLVNSRSVNCIRDSGASSTIVAQKFVLERLHMLCWRDYI